jgi:hypothetical protein
VRTGNLEYSRRIFKDWDIVGLAVGCHAQCIAMDHALLSRSLFETTYCSTYPLLYETARRSRWLRSSLVQVLHGIFKVFSVPLELCEEIARHCCIRKHVICTAKNF